MAGFKRPGNQPGWNTAAFSEVLAMRAAWMGLCVFVGTTVAFANIARAQAGRDLSKAEFSKSCAPCHGPTGKGDGPVAGSLTRPPADLTRLSEKNGGAFPLARVYDVIDGRAQVESHGPREMPVWGDAYARDLHNQWPRDLLSDELVQLMARVRMLMLVEYISTLQGKD
jgi:mono/diheme cytochrome c family protein